MDDRIERRVTCATVTLILILLALAEAIAIRPLVAAPPELRQVTVSGISSAEEPR